MAIKAKTTKKTSIKKAVKDNAPKIYGYFINGYGNNSYNFFKTENELFDYIKKYFQENNLDEDFSSDESNVYFDSRDYEMEIFKIFDNDVVEDISYYYSFNVKVKREINFIPRKED